jgi:hypothetical protein
VIDTVVVKKRQLLAMSPIAFPPETYTMPLLGGDAGVEQTINEMRGLVDEALRDSSIIRMATDIVRGAPAFDDYAEARALYEWVRGNIRFTKDPVNKEKLYPPAELLKIRAGDCDDISMLMGTLLMAVGYPARLMTVAASPGAPDQFSHVYVEGEVPAGSGQWLPMDPARYDSQFGVAPPQFSRARWWSLTDSGYGELPGSDPSGISGLGDYPRYRSHRMSGLGSYGRVRTMGELGDDPASGDTTSSMIATTAQGAASIIRAAEGQPASPFDYSSAGPWSSFQTKYSPGTMPPAGYDSPRGQIAGQLSLSTGAWIAIGVGAYFFLQLWKHK